MDGVELMAMPGKKLQRIAVNELFAYVARLGMDIYTGDVESRELIPASGTSTPTEKIKKSGP